MKDEAKISVILTGGEDLAIEILAKNIPLINNFKRIYHIKKGFSTDEKYIIQLPDQDEKLLLRLFDQVELESKRSEYSVLLQMKDYDITCSEPIDIGEVGNKGYMITSYLEGEDAEDEILKFADKEQFNLGSEAGKELRKMHQCPAPNYVASWYLRKLNKHQKYMDAYSECGTKIKNDEKIIHFIDENIHLMKNRPNLFQHDDFTLGNIIVNNNTFAGVIDFGNYDWGDPIHEFIKIGIFSRRVSIPFSIGQMKGYFNNNDPDDYFWRLYSLYLAMCVFSTVVWTIDAIPESLDDMLEKVYLFLDDHDYFNELKPRWYK